jgi:hypothetical protein
MSANTQDGELDRRVRRLVYDFAEREGLPPTVAQAAAALSLGDDEVAASFRRLAAANMLVLQTESDEILMAPPYSAVPTPFVVESAGRSYYANCVWDALGVPAMLGRDARVKTSCGCCGAALALAVANGTLAEARGVVHFALPARRWWDDIAFT